jgi:hypothetical protein
VTRYRLAGPALLAGVGTTVNQLTVVASAPRGSGLEGVAGAAPRVDRGLLDPLVSPRRPAQDPLYRFEPAQCSDSR